MEVDQDETSRIREVCVAERVRSVSVGLGDRGALVSYIDNQVTHYQRRDFQAEMRAMFAQYGVEFDERFVWD